MNDEFLNRFLEEPRTEFADVLYEHISRQPQSNFAQLLGQRLTLRNAAIGLAVLFFIAACVYAVSEKRWNKIGNIWVEVQRTNKVEFFLSPELPEKSVLQPQFQCFTVEEADEILRFDLRVPTWAPEGFSFDNRICGIDQTSDFASLYWIGADKYSGIQIILRNQRGFNMATQEYEIWPTSTMFPVAPGSYEEVRIYGQPAVLVRGNWEEPWMTEENLEGEMEFNWNKKRGYQLYWIDGEISHYLSTLAEVSSEDLIKMAESAQ